MTDIELTRLCAEAMGLLDLPEYRAEAGRVVNRATQTYYDPLHDKAQAFELVERFHLHILPGLRTPEGRQEWHVVDPHGEGFSKDLNRAIVECVAKIASQDKAPLK